MEPKYKTRKEEQYQSKRQQKHDKRQLKQQQKREQQHKVPVNQQQQSVQQQVKVQIKKYEEYIYDLVFAVERSDDKKAVDIIHECYAIYDRCPYTPFIVDVDNACYNALIAYLQLAGISPDIREHVLDNIEACIVHREVPSAVWDTYISKLVNTSVHDKEIYINHVEHVDRLVQAYKLGFIDHRLEHNIITLQRYWRHHKAHPHEPFEGHDCTTNMKYFIHLQCHDIVNIAPTNIIRRSTEQYILWYNKRLYPFILHQVCSGVGDMLDYVFGYGYIEDLFPEISDLIYSKRETVNKSLFNYFMDDDALHKMIRLLRIHEEGTLFTWRNPQRDVLKFIRFEMKNNVPDSKAHLERFNRLPFSVIDDIVNVLPSTLATHGMQLLTTFNSINIDQLTNAEANKWFIDIIIDEIDIDFGDYLRGRHSKKSYDADVRKYLYIAQTKTRNHEPLYTYTVNIEPVKVFAVQS